MSQGGTEEGKMCDVIKGNEPDVRNIDFEVQAIRYNILMFYMFL